MTEPDATRTTDSPVTTTGGPDLLIRPEELRRITEEKQTAAAMEALKRKERQEQQEKDLYRHFLEQHLEQDRGKRFTEMVRQAAERGERRIEVYRFPAHWCTDHGRAINNNEPEWPTTLTGYAKEGYEAFEKFLRPLGYKMEVQILDYPEGISGNVGIFVSW